MLQRFIFVFPLFLSCSNQAPLNKPVLDSQPLTLSSKPIQTVGILISAVQHFTVISKESNNVQPQKYDVLKASQNTIISRGGIDRSDFSIQSENQDQTIHLSQEPNARSTQKSAVERTTQTSSAKSSPSSAVQFYDNNFENRQNLINLGSSFNNRDKNRGTQSFQSSQTFTERNFQPSLQPSSKDKQMLHHIPDPNPVLPPNQKVMVVIDYPTEDYTSNDKEYTTRAPLKRPYKTRNTTKTSSDS